MKKKVDMKKRGGESLVNECKRQQCPRETWNITVCKGAPSSRL